MEEQQEQNTEQQEQQNTEEQQQQEQTEEKQEDKTSQTPPTEIDKEEIKEKTGFDYEALEKEYFENNGELSIETKEKLNAQGFSDEFINSFIEGKKALYEQEVNDLATVVGGRENYNNLITWSASNLEPQVIQSINEIKDKSILKEFILPALKTKMEEKEGVLPAVKLSGTTSKNLDIFESQAEMFEATQDPRYLKDPVYQAKITAKIRASRNAGIDLGI